MRTILRLLLCAFLLYSYLNESNAQEKRQLPMQYCILNNESSLNAVVDSMIVVAKSINCDNTNYAIKLTFNVEGEILYCKSSILRITRSVDNTYPYSRRAYTIKDGYNIMLYGSHATPFIKYQNKRKFFTYWENLLVTDGESAILEFAYIQGKFKLVYKQIGW